MFTCFLTEDIFYNYAVKLAAVTFKRSIAGRESISFQSAAIS